MISKHVTIKDIAKRLGISASTVSRALKDHPDISQETKNAVIQLAEELHYQPNELALSLKNQRSKTIGLVIPEIVHYFFSSVISGIEDIAYDAGFTVVTCQSNEIFEREVKNIDTLLAHRVDGILISITKETNTFEHLQRAIKSNIPVVFFDRIVPEIKADKVYIDDQNAAYRATRHLLSVGKRRIVHFHSPESLQIGILRREGYLEAIREAAIPVNHRLIVLADNYETSYKETLRLLDHNIQFDGVFAVNDLTAIGAMHALQQRKIKIPEQVAIIGFSDGRFTNIAQPSLSSINQHGYEMGNISMKMLLNRIRAEKDYPSIERVLKSELVVRESSLMPEIKSSNI
jgi:LacI family transcriptional regulator